MSRIIVASHRGPYRFERDETGFVAHRGAGGLVSALGPLLLDRAVDSTWIAAAMSNDDRAAVEAGAAHVSGTDLELLCLDPATHRLHYDEVSNRVLWPWHHGTFDLVREPRFDDSFSAAWYAYTEVNHQFADAVCDVASHDDVILVQDYQLALAVGMIRARDPALKLCYFHHTPYAGPDAIGVLPAPVVAAVVRSTATAPAGFHARRWADAYEGCVARTLGEGSPRAFVAPLGADVDALRAAADTDAAQLARAELDELVGDRRLVYRTDRLELTKNIVRGFLGFDLLLDQRPDLRERVVFVANLYGSRGSLDEYATYAREVERTVDHVNERWATPHWQPIHLDVRDDYPRSIAGLTRYDVLVVNPIKDGLNLVAKEGPILNDRDGTLCLSPEAGAYEELSGAALPCHPFDLTATAAALGSALDEPSSQRRTRARRLRALATATTPQDWLDAQISAAQDGVDGAKMAG